MSEDREGLDFVNGAGSERELRELAVKRLKAKRDFYGHLLAFVTVNLLLVGIWWGTGATFFWPLFPILGWGIGLAFHAWDTFSPGPGPREVEREMERLRRRGISVPRDTMTGAPHDTRPGAGVGQ